MLCTLRSILRPLHLTFVSLAVVVTSYAQDPSPQDTVATISDRFTITYADLAQYVRDYPYAFMYKDRPAEGFYRALDDMIVNQLKRQDFFTLGLADSFGYRGKMTRSINEELVSSYYQTQYAERYINEGALAREYKRMGSVVTYREIRIAVPPGASRRKIDALTALASRIEKRWRAGEDPATFVPRIPSGASVSVNDAEQTVTWSVSMMDENNAVIYELTPGSSRVLYDAQGLRIVKVLARTTQQVPSFGDARADLLKGMEEKYGSRSQREFDRDKAALINESRVTWNHRVLAQIVRWSNVPGFYKYGYGDTLRNALAKGRNESILRAPGLRVDFKEYLRLLNDVLTMGDFVTIGQDDVKRFILEAVRTGMIVEKAKGTDLEKNVYIPDTKNPVISHGILQLYNQHEIDGRIPSPSEEALQAFYEMNKDSLYYQLGKVNLYVIADSAPGPLTALKSRLASGIPFQNLAPLVFVKTYVRNRDSSFRTYLGNEPPFLAETGFRLALNEVTGPVSCVDPSRGTLYALVKCVGVQEEKQLTFDDVAKRIRNDFAEFHRARLEAFVRDRLKQKYDVTIREDVLRRHAPTMNTTAK
jgi:hypothetical protein